MSNKSNRYFLSLLAIFKNEGVIMKEWLDHYIDEGVEHFYLINNGSNDNFEIILTEYIDKGLVTLYNESLKNAQVQHYKKVYNNHKYDTEWLIICDFDEFIYGQNGYNIDTYLKKQPDNIGNIKLKWIMYGSSGHIEQPSSVIKNFNYRQNYDNEYVHILTKNISRTKAISNFDVHSAKLLNGYYENYIVNGDLSEKSIKESPLRLNHYAIQSYNWFKNVKMTRGDVNDKIYDSFRNDKYFKRYDLNDTFDDSLYQKKLKNNSYIETFVSNDISCNISYDKIIYLLLFILIIYLLIIFIIYM